MWLCWNPRETKPLFFAGHYCPPVFRRSVLPVRVQRWKESRKDFGRRSVMHNMGSTSHRACFITLAHCRPLFGAACGGGGQERVLIVAFGRSLVRPFASISEGSSFSFCTTSTWWIVAPRRNCLDGSTEPWRWAPSLGPFRLGYWLIVSGYAKRCCCVLPGEQFSQRCVPVLSRRRLKSLWLFSTERPRQSGQFAFLPLWRNSPTRKIAHSRSASFFHRGSGSVCWAAYSEPCCRDRSEDVCPLRLPPTSCN